MTSSIHRSRAALLCFGGWGLHTCLHLAPRLHALQRRRSALGITHLPDLDRTTSMAVVMPRTVMWQAGVPNPYAGRADVLPDGASPFWAARPQGERASENDVLDVLREIPSGYGSDVLGAAQTAAEFTGEQMYLLASGGRRRRSPSATHALLRPIDLRGPAKTYVDFDGVPAGRPYRPSRLQMMRHGMDWAESFAGAFLRRGVDPTRIDEVTPEDPFVTTTIYVVAPLYEPLATALMWPFVSEMVTRLGDRTAVRVVGLFASGSFALDDSRTVEEAAVHAALCELEPLGGFGRPNEVAVESLRRVVTESHPAWTARVAPTQPLFDAAYVIDREKSSRSIARDAHELSVLAATAVESFLATDAERVLDGQIDQASAKPDFPYRLIGTVSDFVPIDEYLSTAHRDEVHARIRRDVFEDDTPQVDVRGGVLSKDADPKAMASALRVEPHQILSDVRSTRATRKLFRRARPRALVALSNAWKRLRGRSVLSWGGAVLPELRLRREVLRPDVDMRRLGRLREDSRAHAWLAAAREMGQRVVDRVSGAVAGHEFDRAWGLDTTPPMEFVTLEQAQRVLERRHMFTWTRRRVDSDALMPRVLVSVMKDVVLLCGADPAGMRAAVRRIGRLRDGLYELGGEPGADVLREQHESALDLREAEQRLAEDRLAGLRKSLPHTSTIVFRGAVLAIFLGYCFGYLLVIELPDRGIIFEDWLQILVAAAAPLAALLPGALWFMLARMRAADFRRRTMRLLESRANLAADSKAVSRLVDLHRRLSNLIGLLGDGLRESVDLLDARTQPRPPGAPMTEWSGACHLRRAQDAPEVWERVRAIVMAEARRAEKEPRVLWIDGARDMRGWNELGVRMSQRMRLALERPLNESDAQIAASAQALLDAGDSAPADALERIENLNQRRRQGQWCPFREEGQPGVRRCTACDDAARCMFGPDGAPALPETNVGGLLYATYYRGVPNLLDRMKSRSEEQRRALAQLIADLSIETLLLEAQTETSEAPGAVIDERLQLAKLAAGFEYGMDVGRERISVSLMITCDANETRFLDAARRRRLKICGSEDPSSLSFVSVLAGLSREDLVASERVAAEFHRLSDSDRARMVLVGSDTGAIYGERPADVIQSHMQLTGGSRS